MKIFNYRTFSFPVGFISGVLGFILIAIKYNNVFIVLVGFLFLIFGIYLLNIAINHYKALINHGEKITAKCAGLLLEIVDPALIRQQPAVGNSKIFNIKVTGFDTVLGTDREFTSQNLFQEPIADFTKSIDVYINPIDRNDYYVDVRNLSFKKETISFSEAGKYQSKDGKNYTKIN